MFWFGGGLLVLAVASGPGQSPATAGAGSDCTPCHTFAWRLTHPVGVAVTAATSLPLRSGVIHCGTCHDEHRLLGHETRTGSGRDAALRIPAPALCVSCHRPEEADLKSRVAHGVALGRAHLQGRGEITRGARDVRFGMDAESRLCLGCHDGSQANPTSAGDAPSPQRGINLAGSHPIDRAYAPELRGGRRLHPRESLPPELRMPNGRIGCGTCHTPYSPEPAMLPGSNHRSRLCLQCHVK